MLDYYTAWDFDSFDPDFFINESTGTGDGHKMGLWAGAAMQPGPHPLMTFMAYAYSYLRVNNLGQRYVNEDAGYTGGGNAQLIQPAAASWAIWDDKWREELPNQMPYAGGMSWDQDGLTHSRPVDAGRRGRARVLLGNRGWTACAGQQPRGAGKRHGAGSRGHRDLPRHREALQRTRRCGRHRFRQTTRAYGEDRAASLLRPAHERGTGSERQRPHHKRRLRVPHRSGRSHRPGCMPWATTPAACSASTTTK